MLMVFILPHSPSLRMVSNNKPDSKTQTYFVGTFENAWKMAKIISTYPTMRTTMRVLIILGLKGKSSITWVTPKIPNANPRRRTSKLFFSRYPHLLSPSLFYSESELIVIG
ncbi:MAG: hypothetical protein NTX88_08135 [Candidatus Atribacteria bacterium]|nr:hypothetical protein [Candidatus Atribacteria bacterium]